MAYEFPPLNSLRAFEASGRHLNFTKAAKELYVSQAAISHQIKILEDHLGVKLFKRFNKSVSLTNNGLYYHAILKESFSNISKGTKAILERSKNDCLNISLLASFASSWLLPNLPSFQKLYPELEVKIFATNQTVDFHTSDFDLAIRYGNGSWKDTNSIFLLKENYTLCCSPELLKEYPNFSTKDLENFTLIYDDDSFVNWQTFFTKGLKSSCVPKNTLRFNDSGLVIEATKKGMGIGLVRDALASESIKSGQLKQVFDVKIDGVFSYYIVYPNFIQLPEKSVVFIEWLKSIIANQ